MVAHTLANVVWDLIGSSNPDKVAQAFAAAAVDDQDGKDAVLNHLELMKRAVEAQEVRR